MVRERRGYCFNCGDQTKRKATKEWEPFCTMQCAALFARAQIFTILELQLNEETWEYELP